MTDIDLTAAIEAGVNAYDFTNAFGPEKQTRMRAAISAALPHILDQVERVKPTREDVARVIESDAWTLSDDDYFAAYDDGMHGVGHCLSVRSGKRKISLMRADAVLALLPGRTEAEVRKEIAAEVSESRLRHLAHLRPHEVIENLARDIARGGERG